MVREPGNRGCLPDVSNRRERIEGIEFLSRTLSELEWENKVKIKCPNCGYIIFYNRFDPETKHLNLVEKRKRDRLQDCQDQATTLNLAEYHWDKWGSDEIEYLKQSVKDKTRMEIALDLGRTLYSVGSMLKKLRRTSGIPR